MTTIKHLHAIEILDSRGRPTVQCTCHLESGAVGTASVPSGASTGAAEALELRDGDPNRYRGLGCLQAVAHVNNTIQPHLQGKTISSQQALDAQLIELDGTANKSRLGANAILAVSIATAKAIANEQEVALYRYFARMIDNPTPRLPRPMINLFSGGKHAGGQVEVQDIQVLPQRATTIDEVLQATFAIYYTAADWMAQQHQARLLRADEGGLAPPFDTVDEMFQAAVLTIEQEGFTPGTDVALTVDVAASHFYDGTHYQLGRQTLTSQQMVEQLQQWSAQYPIASLEDGLAEDDWDGWRDLMHQVPNALILGDDLLCTNPKRIQQAIDQQAANALLLKVNQIGTLSEAADAYQLAREHGWAIVVSARSGETEDDWLADLAVGWSAEHIKVGSITQSERLAKYNRLLVLEQDADVAAME